VADWGTQAAKREWVMDTTKEKNKTDKSRRDIDLLEFGFIDIKA
jgi:hypothetical protein